MTLGNKAFIKQFEEIFNSATAASPKKYKKAWEESKPEWTSIMLGNKKRRMNKDYGIIGKVGQQFDYIIQSEWMRLDQVWYNDLEWEENLDFTPWKTDVIIEHENEPGRFVRTILKLREASAPLKISFFYPDDLEHEESLTRTAKEMIQKQPMSYPGGVYLFIFGYYTKKKGFYWHYFEIDWKGNVFPLHNKEQDEE